MWHDNDVPSLNVDSVLDVTMENIDVLLNSHELFVEDDQTSDARIWSDIDTNNTPQSMTDQVARGYQAVMSLWPPVTKTWEQISLYPEICVRATSQCPGASLL